MPLEWRHGSLKWKIVLSKRRMEERGRKLEEGLKSWWQCGVSGLRRGISKVKALLWTREEHADPAVELEAHVIAKNCRVP